MNRRPHLRLTMNELGPTENRQGEWAPWLNILLLILLLLLLLIIIIIIIIITYSQFASLRLEAIRSNGLLKQSILQTVAI